MLKKVQVYVINGHLFYTKEEVRKFLFKLKLLAIINKFNPNTTFEELSDDLINQVKNLNKLYEEKPYSLLGEKIQKYLDTNNLTGKELAKKIGISSSQLCKLKTIKPTNEMLKKLNDFFNEDCSKLIEENLEISK
jgi:antitoxin component HigA of HigAB toxin-antitoxin module